MVPDARATGADGRYEVLIVKYGTRSTMRSDVFLNYAVYGDPDASIEMDYFFWVVRNKARTVVVDTGFSAAGGRARNRTMFVNPPDAFAALGVTPESAPVVVLTHGHYDHIGNLAAFPRSEVVMARDEFEFWTGSHARRAQFHHSVDDADLEHLRSVQQQGRLELVDAELELAPGIWLVQVGGHTPGQLMMIAETDEGRVLLTSDAVHYLEELERDMPFAQVANLVEMYDAFERIRRYRAAGEVSHVVTGHDPSTLERFAPYPGVLDGLVSAIGVPSRVDSRRT